MKNGENVEKFLKINDVRDYRNLAKEMTEYNNKTMELFPKKKEVGEDDADDAEEPQPVTYV